MQVCVRRPAQLKSSSPKSISRSKAKASRTAHLSAASHSPQRKRDVLLTFVANCEQPLSLDEPHEKDTVPPPQQEKKDPNKAAIVKRVTSPEGPALAEHLESVLSQIWLYFAVVAVTLAVVVMSYGVLNVLSEAQMRIFCLLPFLWSWGHRFADLRKKPHVWRSVGLALRLGLMYGILALGPFQLRVFIFHYQHALFPVCAIFALIAAVGHWHLQSKSHPAPFELQKPDFASLTPFFTDDVESFQKVEQRLSMTWVYLSGVLVLPLLQEILYRGVVVTSLSYVFNGGFASFVGALAYNLSRPFTSRHQFLATLFSGFMWGCLTVAASQNLMFPFVAHLMHNALLFVAHHRKSLLECF